MNAREAATPVPAKRHYDNTRRRESADRTRQRILDAGAEVVREAPVRDWRGVTVRAVAQRAGVTDRTVYRHFANEDALRRAVMGRLEEQVGIELADLGLGGVADAAARIFRHVSGYPAASPPELDPALAEVNRRRQDALLRAVQDHAGDWPGTDRMIAAAVLDVLWSISSYERIVRDWTLGTDEAVRAASWAIGLVEDAIRTGRRPSGDPRRATRR